MLRWSHPPSKKYAFVFCLSVKKIIFFSDRTMLSDNWSFDEIVCRLGPTHIPVSLHVSKARGFQTILAKEIRGDHADGTK